MRFEDLTEQGYVYHVVGINDLKHALEYGIEYDDKKTYAGKYYAFHTFFDQNKTARVPGWVERKKAVFGSLGFKEGHGWHSHTAVLRLKIDKSKCWICNENTANFLFEPFVMQKLQNCRNAKDFLMHHGRKIAEIYWDTSLSYQENLEQRKDRQEGYDAEVLILHSIPPENITCLYIVSDHLTLSFEEWQHFFRQCSAEGEAQYIKYLHPRRTYSAWNISGSQ